MTLKVDLAELSWRVSAFSESRAAELEKELQILSGERILLETKLEEASREPGMLNSLFGSTSQNQHFFLPYHSIRSF